MNILYMPLKAKWYEMIERGEKTEEYREIKKHWGQRILRCCWSFDLCNTLGNCCENCNLFRRRFKDYTHVRFSYGYTKRKMTFEVKEITIGKGKPEWGAPTDREVFIIKLGERIS
ncbi:MAG: hypothetical protein ACI30A_06560 [Paludibacteraceae bacterium]